MRAYSHLLFTPVPSRLPPTFVPCSQACWDFAHESTALQEQFRARGHILLMCVKGHPELAGVGIENSWGKSAIHFRQHNDCVAKNLRVNVLNSLHSNNLPLRTVRKFATKTREYLRAYRGGHKTTANFKMVEKMRKIFKTHRKDLQDTQKLARFRFQVHPGRLRPRGVL